MLVLERGQVALAEVEALLDVVEREPAAFPRFTEGGTDVEHCGSSTCGKTALSVWKLTGRSGGEVGGSGEKKKPPDGGFLDGAEGARTPDLLAASQSLSQLSYGPASAAQCRATRFQPGCGRFRPIERTTATCLKTGCGAGTRATGKPLSPVDRPARIRAGGDRSRNRRWGPPRARGARAAARPRPLRAPPPAPPRAAHADRRARDRGRRGGARDDGGRQRLRAGSRRPAGARAARAERPRRSRRSGAACPRSRASRTRSSTASRAASTAPILGQAPFAVVVFRQATWGGAFVNLGAVDGLARWLDLRSGRLPKHCVAAGLRADPDRRRARGAEAAVPARRRARDVQGRRAAPVVLRRRRREAAADPACRRCACRSSAHRFPTRRSSRARTAGSSRLRRARSTTGSSRASTRASTVRSRRSSSAPTSSRSPRRPTRSRRSARRAGSPASGCSSSAAMRPCCCSASRSSRRRACAATTATCGSG